MPDINQKSVAARPLPQARERIAVNLFDLDRVDPTIRQMLLGGKLHADKSRLVNADPSRVDEVGVEFCCDALTAACICDTLRRHDKQAGDSPTRVYLFRRAWSRVPGAALLTVVEGGGQVYLNPDVFNVPLPPVRAEGLAPSPIQFGAD